uniref:Major facilitator superfamily domain-containing protein 6 n=1 Tax=Cacopsylla melanoneura TaxID=428564 RepID=A0A8D8T4W9_9HEMI
MKFFKTFFGRITSDFRQKELLTLKLLFFVHASTLYVLYPYLTIHMRELGINVEETAIMSAVTPCVAIIMPPIAGIIADKIGNFKVLLALFSSLGGCVSLLLLLVPVGRMTITYPDRTIVKFGCDFMTGSERVTLTLAEDHLCMPVTTYNSTIPVRLEACGIICERSKKDYDLDVKSSKTLKQESIAILRARSYFVTEDRGKFYYELTAEDIPNFTSRIGDARNYRFMKNKERFTTSVRNLTKTKYFFPTNGLYNFNCDVKGSTYVCDINEENKWSNKSQSYRFVSRNYTVKVQPVDFLKTGVREFKVITLNEPKGDVSGFQQTTCIDDLNLASRNLSISVPLLNPDNNLQTSSILKMTQCEPSCLATIPRGAICSNSKHIVEYDTSLTFWTYLLVRVFIGIIGGTAFAMFEGAVIAILREHKGDYGLQRIYASIGGMISSPLSGILIDYASRGKGYTDFRPAFYLYAALKLISGALMLCINLEFKNPATNVLTDVITVLRNTEMVALFIACFILGTAWGYIESFLFWLLQDLGASRSLMGITITIGGIAGLPLLVMSGPIIDKFGHANVIFIGFLFYAIRLIGYSMITEAWQCLIFEAMESITSSLAFTAAVTYAAKLSTNTTDSSVQGLLGGIYYGVGKGAGSLIGGYLMKGFGTKITYQLFAATMVLTGCMYYVFNKVFIVPLDKNRKADEENCKKKKGSLTTNDLTLSNINNNNNIPVTPPPSYKNLTGANDNAGFDIDENCNEKKTLER